MAGNEDLKPRVIVERRVIGRFGRTRSSEVVFPYHEEALTNRDGVRFNVEVLPTGVAFNNGFVRVPGSDREIPTTAYIVTSRVKGKDHQGNSVAYVSKELPHLSSR